MKCTGKVPLWPYEEQSFTNISDKYAVSIFKVEVSYPLLPWRWRQQVPYNLSVSVRIKAIDQRYVKDMRIEFHQIPRLSFEILTGV
jgi:hypothetical protein